LPVKRIVRELESRGVEVLVDGAHAPGMLPLDVEELNASWYCGNLHKWVCAPKGSAFLWARRDQQETLMPAVISHGNNTQRSGFSAFQDRFDWAGTFDPTAWFCVPAAIRWMDQVVPGGWNAVRKANHQLALDARRMLCDALEVPVLCPDSMIGSMATILLPERFQNRVSVSRPVEVQAQLYDEFGIEVPFVSIGNIRGFRLSAQLYNHMDEYRYLADMLNGMK
jgi:isopenicillin-N epimerase